MAAARRPMSHPPRWPSNNNKPQQPGCWGEPATGFTVGSAAAHIPIPAPGVLQGSLSPLLCLL